jgi:hypothetical protein
LFFYVNGVGGCWWINEDFGSGIGGLLWDGEMVFEIGEE